MIVGQRYHVVVQGLKEPLEAERNGNFWMRTIPARKCSKFAYGPDQQMGIIRYDQKKDVEGETPLSEPHLFDIACNDEPAFNLTPFFPWKVQDPVNISMIVYLPALDTANLPLDRRWKNADGIPWDKQYIFNVSLHQTGGPNNTNESVYIPDDKAYVRHASYSNVKLTWSPRNDGICITHPSASISASRLFSTSISSMN